MSDSDEHEAERRHRQPGRRESDTRDFNSAVSREVIDDDVRAIAMALQKIQKGWKRWFTVIGAIGTVITSTIAVMIWLGWTNSSPNQRFAQHDSTMRANIGEVRGEFMTLKNTDVAQLKSRVSNLEEAMDLVSYLLCVQIRRTDPASVPPKCNDATIRNLAPR